jgi:hypothetical protein
MLDQITQAAGLVVVGMPTLEAVAVATSSQQGDSGFFSFNKLGIPVALNYFARQFTPTPHTRQDNQPR